MATIEVYEFHNGTATAVWPFDTPEEREQWLERFKEATTEFILAADRDIAEYNRKERSAKQQEEDKKEESSNGI